MAVPTLTYFSLPGKAEVSRLLLHIGDVQHVDKRITFDEWREGDLKASTPFGQLPVLEVDGKTIAQSAAIHRYCAHLAGMMPSDPLEAAIADQVYFFCEEDLWRTVYPTFAIKDPEEKAKARVELLAGELGKKLSLLQGLVEKRPGTYMAGDSLTHGDLAVFGVLSTLQSGWLDGLPTDVLDGYPALKEFRESIACLPKIKAFYDKENDDIRVKGFRARGE